MRLTNRTDYVIDVEFKIIIKLVCGRTGQKVMNNNGIMNLIILIILYIVKYLRYF